MSRIEELINAVPLNQPLKIMIGAEAQVYDGWISSQQDELNVLDFESLDRIFKNRKADAFLAEHVWEHMNFEEGLLAAKNCYSYLNYGGYFRCAVPDGNFKDEDYQKIIQIGGPGPKEHPAYTHKIVYEYKLFLKLFEEAGFRVDLLEYCDENGRLHYNQWNPKKGMINRTLLNDSRNKPDKLKIVSILIDAYKRLEK